MTDEIQRWRSHYDFTRAMYDPRAPKGAGRIAAITAALRALGDMSSAEALDLCCGMGVSTFAVEALTRTVVGVDLSRDFIEVARAAATERGSRARFEVMDAGALSLPDASLDLVTLLGNSLFHFNARTLRPVIAEVARVLRPGGYVVIDYMDFIRLALSGKYHQLAFQAMGATWRATRHAGYASRDGVLRRDVFPGGGAESHTEEYGVWSPFLLELLLDVSGLTGIRTAHADSELPLTIARRPG